jgi:hypothetical protein
MNLPSQVIYQLVVNNIAPVMASSVSSMCSSYFSSKRESIIKTMQEVDDERELDLLQMDRLLKWMCLIFEEGKNDREETLETLNEKKETMTKYKQELYSIYKTICSDYKEYERWKKYNSSLWILPSYRNKNTKFLAKKILSDIKLFNEGLNIFSMFEKIK